VEEFTKPDGESQTGPDPMPQTAMREGGIQTKNTTGRPWLRHAARKVKTKREAVSQQPYGSTGVFPAQEQTASFRLIPRWTQI
jgi:hypothetical protein